MSERDAEIAELRALEASDPETDASEDLFAGSDAEREAPQPPQTDQEEESGSVLDEDVLSAEALVAEAVRQDLASDGLAETETETADPLPGDGPLTPEQEMDLIRQKAARADAWDAWAANEAIERETREIGAEAEHEAQLVKNHYDAELERFVEEIVEASYGATDPATYRRNEIAKARAAVDREWRLWREAKIAEVEARTQVVTWKRDRDDFCTYLIEQLDIPRSRAISEEILKAADPELSVAKQASLMQERAELLARMASRHKALLSETSTTVRNSKAAVVAASNVHPSGTGAPRRLKPVEYTGSKAELAAIERLAN